MWSPSTDGEQARPSSEVMVMNDMPPSELVSRASPVISSMNITKSSRVHIGPKFVSVTQNVENTELVKGRILGLELVAPAKQTGLRCSVAVFVCWALVIAVGLGLYLFQVAIQPTRIDLGTSLERLLDAEDSDAEFYTWSDYQDHIRSTRNKTYPCPLYVWTIVRNTTRAERLSCAAALLALLLCTALVLYFTVLAKRSDVNDVDRAPHEWNITREMWLARAPTGNNTVEEFTPLKLVIVQHTVSPECHRFTNCAAEMRNLQRYFLDTPHLQYDLPYNFVIGNDGRVYESRGWLREGAHTAGYNRCSLGVAFIGDYRDQDTTGLIHSRVTDLQLQRFTMLLEEGVARGFLRPDYSVLGANDVTITASPGANLYHALQKLKHYERTHNWRGMNCTEIHKQLNSITK